MGADGRTILVVDDDADVLAICERMLAAAGYRVACVASGGEAIERVAEEQPALVLLDLAMPDMSGLTLVRTLRADPRWSTVPIVAISALGDTAAADALAAGCTDFHAKPLAPRTILNVIARLLGHANSNGSAIPSPQGDP